MLFIGFQCLKSVVKYCNECTDDQGEEKTVRPWMYHVWCTCFNFCIL